MKNFLSRFLKKLCARLKALAYEDADRCRCCGICHHVCQLVKNKKSGKLQEE